MLNLMEQHCDHMMTRVEAKGYRKELLKERYELFEVINQGDGRDHLTCHELTNRQVSLREDSKTKTDHMCHHVYNKYRMITVITLVLSCRCRWWQASRLTDVSWEICSTTLKTVKSRWHDSYRTEMNTRWRHTHHRCHSECQFDIFTSRPPRYVAYLIHGTSHVRTWSGRLAVDISSRFLARCFSQPMVGPSQHDDVVMMTTITSTDPPTAYRKTVPCQIPRSQRSSTCRWSTHLHHSSM